MKNGARMNTVLYHKQAGGSYCQIVLGNNTLRLNALLKAGQNRSSDS
jgi:hypothetical protein